MELVVSDSKAGFVWGICMALKKGPRARAVSVRRTYGLNVTVSTTGAMKVYLAQRTDEVFFAGDFVDEETGRAVEVDLAFEAV